MTKTDSSTIWRLPMSWFGVLVLQAVQFHMFLEQQMFSVRMQTVKLRRMCRFKESSLMDQLGQIYLWRTCQCCSTSTTSLCLRPIHGNGILIQGCSVYGLHGRDKDFAKLHRPKNTNSLTKNQVNDSSLDEASILPAYWTWLSSISPLEISQYILANICWPCNDMAQI